MKNGASENNELGNVFSSRELEILHMDGAHSHNKGVRRSSNPHSIPEARAMWEHGWIADQIRMTKQTRRTYYLRRKHEKAMEEANGQA